MKKSMLYNILSSHSADKSIQNTSTLFLLGCKFVKLKWQKQKQDFMLRDIKLMSGSVLLQSWDCRKEGVKNIQTFLILARSLRVDIWSAGICWPSTLDRTSSLLYTSSLLWIRTIRTALSFSEIPNLLKASEIYVEVQRKKKIYNPAEDTASDLKSKPIYEISSRYAVGKHHLRCLLVKGWKWFQNISSLSSFFQSSAHELLYLLLEEFGRDPTPSQRHSKSIHTYMYLNVI